MIVIGTDTHKASHTAAAVNAATGQVLADRTVRAQAPLVRGPVAVGAGVWAASGCGRLRTAVTLGGARAVPARARGTRRARRAEADRRRARQRA